MIIVPGLLAGLGAWKARRKSQQAERQAAGVRAG
jgi:hypothetical protein